MACSASCPTSFRSVPSAPKGLRPICPSSIICEADGKHARCILIPPPPPFSLQSMAIFFAHAMMVQPILEAENACLLFCTAPLTLLDVHLCQFVS